MIRRLVAVFGLVLAASVAAVSTAATAPAAPARPGMERFYSQQLSWGACAPFATTQDDAETFANPAVQCARLTVPLDYADPGGATATIGVLRLRATGAPTERIGSLLVNPGGPGGSGMSLAAQFAAGAGGGGDGLPRHFDLVGFDPRGVGASQPAIRCRTTAEIDAERLDLDIDPSPAGVASTEAEEATFHRRCVERVGTDVLANVGTRDAAHDMDVLRAALGDDRLTYLGYSYGTRLGTEYARQFPLNVRAMVLDGALDPTQSLLELNIAQYVGFQQAFDAFATACAAQPSCWLDRPAGQADASYQQLVRPLIAKPLKVGDRTLGYPDAVIGTLTALYSSQSWGALDAALTGLRTGDGTVLLSLADSYFRRDPGGYANSDDAYNVIMCADEPPIDDPAKALEMSRRTRAAAPFLDPGTPPSAARGRDTCAAWPVAPTRTPGAPQVDRLPPVLVISTTGDPATPYANGVSLARQLHARLLTFEGTQHTVALQGVPCVDDAVSAYLTDLTLPAPGTRCANPG